MPQEDRPAGAGEGTRSHRTQAPLSEGLPCRSHFQPVQVSGHSNHPGPGRAYGPGSQDLRACSPTPSKLKQMVPQNISTVTESRSMWRVASSFSVTGPGFLPGTSKTHPPSRNLAANDAGLCCLPETLGEGKGAGSDSSTKQGCNKWSRKPEAPYESKLLGGMTHSDTVTTESACYSATQR